MSKSQNKRYYVYKQAGYVIWYILWILAIVLSAIQRDWREFLLWASVPIAMIMGVLASLLVTSGEKRKREGIRTTVSNGTSCLVLLPFFWLVHVVNLVLFGLDWKSENGILVIAGVVIPFIWGAAMLVYYLYERFGQKNCHKCQQPAQFFLAKGSPAQISDISLCQKHFVEKLRSRLRRFNGKFILVDRNASKTGKCAQYLFYKPEDMTLDGYREDDINIVKHLITDMLDKDTANNSSLAVKLPHDVMKPVSDWNNNLLFLLKPEQISGTPISLEEFIAYIDEITSDYNQPERKFRMNLPYANRGIYIWHDYI